MSPDPRTHRATELLHGVRSGADGAREELFEFVFTDLRELAAAACAHERPGHTLQPTALVGEVYLRLFGGQEIEWRDRSHFFGVAAHCLRQALVAHAREREALKRGGHWQRVTLGEAPGEDDRGAVDLLALDEALEKLAGLDERQAKVVELRFFGGLSVEETAEALGVSERTVKSDWQVARMWLHRELE